jgi:protein-S-isoprenylcysteine O-methyltransferase Ste14
MAILRHLLSIAILLGTVAVAVPIRIARRNHIALAAPVLTAMFGDDYREYRRHVRRFIPRLRPYDGRRCG